MSDKVYLCIDLKSFYASVECVERHLDPFKINLVVADPSRGSGAITLAATPAIKELGVKSRGRIFEIPKGIEYITAKPRMALYLEYSAKIYSIFLKFISKDDIHVYSIDESFLDVTSYISLYHKDAREIAKMIMDAILEETGIVSTCGIGPNLFLCKVALDINAKHSPDNISYLDEDLFRQTMWHHQPLTDFWMIGHGTVNRLNAIGIYDLYGVAHCNESYLYQLFGVNAEYLIDHSWGRESTTIQDIKKYKPAHQSMSNSQIFFEDYSYQDAYLVMKEMVEINVLNLVDEHLVTNHIALYVGYSKNTIKPSRGSVKITNTTNSYKILLEEFKLLYKRVVNPHYPIRQISISFGNVIDEIYEEYDLFADLEELDKEKRLQQAINEVHHKYGKNALVKGMNMYDKATGTKRNKMIGGHNA